MQWYWVLLIAMFAFLFGFSVCAIFSSRGMTRWEALLKTARAEAAEWHRFYSAASEWYERIYGEPLWLEMLADAPNAPLPIDRDKWRKHDG